MIYTCIRCGNKFESKHKTAVCPDCHMAVCVVCGKEFSLKHPYTAKTCLSKCRGIYRKECGISKNVYEKAKKTNLSRYGYENVGQVTEFIKRREGTCEQRYGAKRVLTLDKFQEKAKRTVQKHYGVDYPCQSPELLERQEGTCMKRFGVDNYFKPKTNLQSAISDSSKLDNWISFREDSITYIKSNFNHKPNI